MVKSPSATPPHSTPQKDDGAGPVQASEAEVKPGSIIIKVGDQAGQEIVFKLKRNKVLGKLMAAYCEAKSIKNQDDVRFLYDGERLKGPETPDSLEMEDEDRIDVFLTQIGGSI
ncbi:ubiquitin family protein [Rutstroemia sp. NJR-2017a BVV2]|nr:ubiquitin family protein [Rutstroemia sp. NJR-2017a BVV2]